MAAAAFNADHQAQVAGLLLAAALGACANIEAPPGGPPDTAAPAVLSVRPESGAVVPAWDEPAVIRFDEVIDEMASGTGGVTGLARQVILSPVAGEVAVSWRRTAIGVQPKEGWKAGRVYRLQLLPGVLDLRRNRLQTGRTVIFSTGPAIPGAAVSGTALHWTEQRLLGGALIQAVRRPDTVPYLTLADSTGDFALPGIPPGDYIVYAAHDQNTNRRRDAREPYDSVRVRVDSSATVLLWVFAHDTAGPRLQAAEPLDSTTFRVRFTQHLDPATRPDTGMVRVFSLPDTTPVRVAALLLPAEYDSLRARARAAADTARRARGDTAGAARPVPDTSRARRLLARRPAPVDRLVVRTAAPLTPDSRYLVRVAGARNLAGAIGGGQQVLSIPKPSAPDTTRTP